MVDGFAGATGAIALDWVFTSSASTVGVSDCIATEAHGCVFTLTRSGATSGCKRAHCHRAGVRHRRRLHRRSSKVTFAAGVVTKTVTVALTDDDLTEANESFTLALSDPVGTTLASTVRGTVRDGTIVVTAPFSSTEAATIGRAVSASERPATGSARARRRALPRRAGAAGGLGLGAPGADEQRPGHAQGPVLAVRGQCECVCAARLGLTVRSFHIFGARVLEFADTATPR